MTKVFFHSLFLSYSLRRRLLVSATCLLIVLLGLMGLFLHNAFKQSVLDNAHDSLKNNILLLVSAIDLDENKFKIPAVLPEPRFSQVDSGLYAHVLNSNTLQRWNSASLLGETMPELESEVGGYTFFENTRLGTQEQVYGMSLSVIWETEQGDVPLTIQVMEKNTIYIERLHRYQQQLWFWLVSLGVIFLALQLLLLGWALKPLKRVTQQVGEIENAERRYFDEDYPKEVSRLTQSLNQLLSFEEQQIRRHKEVLGNLAHSLKTPLAVLKGINYADRDEVEVNKQLSTMQDIIDYQLQSSSAVGRRHFVKPIKVEEPTRQIIESLKKLYQDKKIVVNTDIDPNAIFYGDKGDWMEVVGNLLDNAFKWATREIDLTVININEKSGLRKMIKLVVSDDGIGIDENLMESILQRGTRLDSQAPGQGLGLNIVKNIVDAYDGNLNISTSKPKGTLFEVTI